MGNFKKSTKKSHSYLIQAKNLCLICFKECTSESVGIGKLLCRILERYFSVNFRVPELSLELQHSDTTTNSKSNRSNAHFLICENCSALGGKIDHLFKKLELIQMKLNACGQNLCDIMNSAERVPSRIEAFNDRMASFKEKADRKMKIVQNVRREIVKKCNNKIERKLTNSMLPTAKLVIAKMPVPNDDYADNFPPLVNVEQSQDFSEIDENYHSALVGCTMSFCVVILLSFLNVDQPVKAEDKANIDIMLSNTNTISAVDDMEDINSADCSENKSAFQILMTYGIRKRKISKEEHNENEPPTIKRLLIKPTSSVSGESTDSVSEEDINREEWRIGEIEREQGNETPKGIENSSMITLDEAINAVKAIPMVYQGVAKTKTLQINKESDLYPSPIPKREFPIGNDSTHKMECEDENVLSRTEEESVQEPFAIAIKQDNMQEPCPIDIKQDNQQGPCPIDIKQDNQQEKSSNSTALSLVPVNNAPNANNIVQLTYKCHVCLERFNSRAKIEKHRVVVHNFTNYVQCPSCFQMLPSYFQLELHRRDQQECRLDATRKQMELGDIARPYFPFEIIINGRHFCPFEDCCEVFGDINNLILHIKVHGKFQCQSGCSQVFGKGHELAVHELTVHRFGIVNAQNVFQCPRSRCDFVCKRRDEYIPHFMQAHLNIITQ